MADRKDGWRLVPIVPTAEMKQAADIDTPGPMTAWKCWQVMLERAPTPGIGSETLGGGPANQSSRAFRESALDLAKDVEWFVRMQGNNDPGMKQCVDKAKAFIKAHGGSDA